MEYAKFWAAVAGSGVTAAMGIWGPDTTVGKVLIVAAAITTAIVVRQIPNRHTDSH